MFEMLDQFILKFFTKISHSFQRMTGRTNFFLAKCAALLVAVSTSVGALGYFAEVLVREPSFFIAMIEVFLTIAFIRTAYLCDLSEEDTFRGGTRRKWLLLNYSRAWRPFLFVGVLLSIPASIIEVPIAPNSILEALHHGFIPFSFLFLYFIEVNPLPPCRGKIQEFVASLFGRLELEKESS